MTLREEIVLGRVRASSLDRVTRLNLWGNSLNDVSIVRRMPNLKVLSLSFNKIDSLEDFQLCESLEELYLRKNRVESIDEVRFLTKLTKLKVLWLCENPCSEDQEYRLKVISMLPGLEKLDSKDVDSEEVDKAKKVFGGYLSRITAPKTVKQEKTDEFMVHENQFSRAPMKEIVEERVVEQKQPRGALNNGPPFPHIALPPVFDEGPDLPPPPPQGDTREKYEEQQEMIEKLNRTIINMKRKISGYEGGRSKRSSRSSDGEDLKSAKRSILVAILGLMSELDDSQLLMLQKEIQNLLLIRKK